MKTKDRRLMKFVGRSAFAVALIFLSGSAACRSTERNARQFGESFRIRLGLEVFLETPARWVGGKRVGLVTNPTGVNADLFSGVTLMIEHSEIDLAVLYGPEHGIRGDAQAGESVPFFMDDVFDLPVFSLYGPFEKPSTGMLKGIDATMRAFDTQNTGKIPEKDMVKEIDVMVFDMQDVGTRIYTYISTMAYCMQACADAEIPFIVLDRPNPINGIDMEGPLLEYPEFSSFVGLYPIPVRHGLTIGELAGLFNGEFMDGKVDLHVVPMRGWKREMWFDETGLPWVNPSPNMPTLNTAAVYPGQVFLEGTNISEGRGTTKPFEFMGAPWIDGNSLCREMNERKLPGAYFRESWFTPTFSKYKGERCGGGQIHVTDRNRYRSFSTTLVLLSTIRRMYPEKMKFHVRYFDLIMGTPGIREALEEGMDVEKIVQSYQADLDTFADLRKPYLLY